MGPINTVTSDTTGLKFNFGAPPNELIQSTSTPAPYTWQGYADATSQQQAPASAPAPVAAPQPTYTAPNGRTYSSQAAYLAERQAQANALKSGLTGLVNNIKGVYDAMYGDVNVVAADKNANILESYNTDVSGLTSQFADEFPAIGRAYSARNTYDSSYRMDSEGRATKGFERTVEGRGRDRDQDMAAAGQWVAQQQGQIGAEKGLQDTIIKQIQASSNPDELTQLRNTLDAKLAQLNADRAGLRSKASYLDTLNKAVPAGSRLAGLRTNLTNVIQSQVPTALKRQIGVELIQGAGLTPEEAQAALSEFNVVVAKEEEQPVAPSTA